MDYSCAVPKSNIKPGQLALISFWSFNLANYYASDRFLVANS